MGESAWWCVSDSNLSLCFSIVENVFSWNAGGFGHEASSAAAGLRAERGAEVFETEAPSTADVRVERGAGADRVDKMTTSSSVEPENAKILTSSSHLAS